jgi:magnesium transporter
VIDEVCKEMGVHTLNAEDVINTYQRPKVEAFEDHFCVIARQIQILNDTLKNEQISFFIPITFFAGVYGMNFKHIPELDWKYSYPVFWIGCLSMTTGLAVFFWRKGWIGRK